MITETVMVYVDDLDAMGVVHNGRYAALLERALAAYWPGRAERPIPAPPVSPRCSSWSGSSPSPIARRSPGSGPCGCSCGSITSAAPVPCTGSGSGQMMVRWCTPRAAGSRSGSIQPRCGRPGSAWTSGRHSAPPGPRPSRREGRRVRCYPCSPGGTSAWSARPATSPSRRPGPGMTAARQGRADRTDSSIQAAASGSAPTPMLPSA